jgi:hypothetical protein
MSGGVPVELTDDTGRITDEVVLLARSRILVEKTQFDRFVVNTGRLGPGFAQLDRPQIDDCG